MGQRWILWGADTSVGQTRAPDPRSTQLPLLLTSLPPLSRPCAHYFRPYPELPPATPPLQTHSVLALPPVISQHPPLNPPLSGDLHQFLIKELQSFIKKPQLFNFRSSPSLPPLHAPTPRDFRPFIPLHRPNPNPSSPQGLFRIKPRPFRLPFTNFLLQSPNPSLQSLKIATSGLHPHFRPSPYPFIHTSALNPTHSHSLPPLTRPIRLHFRP